MKVASTKGGRNLDTLIDEIADSIVDKETMLRDITKYLEVDMTALPQFDTDGNISFYEIGGILLGKSALVKFIERCK